MTERDRIVLDALVDLQEQAEQYNLCPATFYALRNEVLRIMGERDGYKHRLDAAYAALQE